MKSVRYQFPDINTLRSGLASVVAGNGSKGTQVKILKRRRNINSSTFASEIVTCRLHQGNDLLLLCKYGGEHDDNVYGHKGGVAYEAAVYEYLLKPLRISTPKFYGSHEELSARRTWLVIEYLNTSERLSITADTTAAITAAARWIGNFHRATFMTTHLRKASHTFNTYNVDYYLGWARRTLAFAEVLHDRFPWLSPVCEQFEAVAKELLAAPQTAIHGEYYPKNILFRRGVVYPVDWESLALAPGEIDLASLTEGWPAEIVRRCEREYRSARWPNGAPPSFDRTLAVARLYLTLRWLGDRPDWTIAKRHLCHFRQLRSIAEQLEMI